MKSLLLLAFSAITFFLCVQTKDLMDFMYVDRIECNFNKDICGSPLCKLKFYNRTTKLTTISCVAIVPYETINIISTLHYRFTGGYRQFAINHESDWCKFTNGTETSVLLHLYGQFIKGYANFDRKCPLTGNNSVADLPITAKIFGGQLLPAGDYLHRIIVNINGMHGLTWKGYFNIPTGRTIFDDAMGK